MRIPCRHPSIHPPSTSPLQVPHVVNKNSSSLPSFRFRPRCIVSILVCRPVHRRFKSKFLSITFYMSPGFWVATPYRACSEKPLLQKRLLFYLLFPLPSCVNVLPTFDHSSISSISSSNLVLSRIDSCLQSCLVSLSLLSSPLCIPSISTSVFSHIVDTLFQSPPPFVRSSSRSVSTFFQSLFPSLSPMYPRTPFPYLINSHLGFSILPPSHPCSPCRQSLL